MTTLAGYGIVFDSPSLNLGGFTEEIASGAIDRTLRDKTADLRALIEHDPGRLIGRMSSGTLRVAKDRTGLYVSVDPPDTNDGRDIAELVRRRDVTGMSFAFQTVTDEWRDDPRDQVPRRRVVDMAVREVSLVAWPAYPATTAGLRSYPPTRGAASVSTRLAHAAIDGALFAMERRSMWEIAATKNDAGEVIAHDEGRRSLKRYLDAKKAGRPKDALGDPMVYRSTRTPAGWRGRWVSRHLSVAAAARRSLEVERLIARDAQRRPS